MGGTAMTVHWQRVRKTLSQLLIVRRFWREIKQDERLNDRGIGDHTRHQQFDGSYTCLRLYIG